MIHYRTLTTLLLGAWLGASILVDVAVTQNFHAVDRFLESAAPEARAQERPMLRRNAAEENAWIFLNWERVEFAIGVALLLLMVLEDRQRTMSLAACVVLMVIVAAEHFLLTPRIISLGNVVESLPPSGPQYKKFWMMHGFYSGLDVLKMLVMFALGARRVFARKRVSGRQEALIHG